MGYLAPSFLLLFFVVFGHSDAAKLAVSGTDLVYNGQTVYLNGVNIAWNNYGNDFGNGQYDGTLETYLQEISAAGGNSIRVWVHVEGEFTPLFDSSGYVTACDSTGDFVNNLKQFLDAAQTYDILVIFALWNGAVMNHQNSIDLIYDDSKLESYFTNCLNGAVASVAGHPALGAWETINEPEGSVLVESSAEPCYDTSVIGNAGAGWTGKSIPMERFLHFIGRHNQVFKSNDPSTLTTLGSWSQYPQTSAIENSFNFYSDECLNLAVGGTGAGIDFAQMHVYDWGSSWSPGAPFTVSASSYGLNKPNVLGEYTSICGLSTPLGELHQYAYDNGYNGGLSWHWVASGSCSDSKDEQSAALGQLSGQTSNGVVDFTVE